MYALKHGVPERAILYGGPLFLLSSKRTSTTATCVLSRITRAGSAKKFSTTGISLHRWDAANHADAVAHAGLALRVQT